MGLGDDICGDILDTLVALKCKVHKDCSIDGTEKQLVTYRNVPLGPFSDRTKLRSSLSLGSSVVRRDAIDVIGEEVPKVWGNPGASFN